MIECFNTSFSYRAFDKEKQKGRKERDRWGKGSAWKLINLCPRYEPRLSHTRSALGSLLLGPLLQYLERSAFGSSLLGLLRYLELPFFSSSPSLLGSLPFLYARTLSLYFPLSVRVKDFHARGYIIESMGRFKRPQNAVPASVPTW